MALSPERARLRASIANAVGRGDQRAADEARRKYRTVSAAEYIQRVVDASPPLTEDQRHRLADILRGDGIQPLKAS